MIILNPDAALYIMVVLGCSRKDPYMYLPHGGNFCDSGGKEKCLKMSKGEGRHVDVSLSKGLHFVKSHCSLMYGMIYQAKCL